jgi:hypothetical protein
MVLIVDGQCFAFGCFNSLASKNEHFRWADPSGYLLGLLFGLEVSVGPMIAADPSNGEQP